MSLITLPEHIYPQSQGFELQSNTRIFRSPFSGQIQTVETPGAYWKIAYNYPTMNDTNIRLFKAFLAKLRGHANRLTARDFTFTGQSTSVNITAIQGESTATLSTAVTFAAGDYFSVNYEMKMVVEASTGTTVTVEPPFRNTYSAQAGVLLKPTCQMVLDSDSVSWTSTQCGFSNLDFSCSEAI